MRVLRSNKPFESVACRASTAALAALKGKTLRVAAILLVSSCLPLSSAADEYWKMARITCAPELGVFEVHATGAANIRELGWTDSRSDRSRVAEKHGLFIAGDINRSCALLATEIRASIKYREPSPGGACGANPGAELNLWVNGQHVVNHMPFHESCYDVSAYFLKVDMHNVLVCGGKEYGFQTCVLKNLRSGKDPLDRGHLEDAIARKGS